MKNLFDNVKARKAEKEEAESIEIMNNIEDPKWRRKYIAKQIGKEVVRGVVYSASGIVLGVVVGTVLRVIKDNK